MATAGVAPARSALALPGAIRALLLVGPLTAAAAVLASLAAGAPSYAVPSWAPAAAVVALALGVPHGAVDHLALVGPARTHRGVLALLYLGTAVAAAALVLLAPVPAFVAVVVMSVWHFGSGDVEAAAETGVGPAPAPWQRRLHVLAAGSVPVVLPLTAAGAASTLVALEPRLEVLTSSPAVPVVRLAVLALAAVVALLLVLDGRPAAAAELALLVTLALVATPLLAFAVYFAGWHAVRHTLRLALDDDGGLDQQRLGVVLRAGLPSLLVTLALIAAASTGLGASTPTVLWWALAAVWGLTVPHMVVVGAFDRRRRAARTLSPARPSPAAART
jgi:Brp/Blh family beta-carotene 15,15'-monooxygenase